jgi:hypothetical protein
MLTSESLIAKAVTSLIGKVGSSLVNIAGSKRQQSCRYLVKLYYALQSLDEITARLLQSVESDPRTSPASSLLTFLVQEQDAIEYSTNAFVDLSRDLQRGLALIDPPLHQLCRDLYRGKADFLSCMSFGLRPDFSGSKTKVVFWIPNERLLATDFDAAYAQSCDVVSAGKEYYWPSGAFDYMQDCEDVEVTQGSEEAAMRAIDFIRQHHKSLSEARARLRALLKESFTIEELLFHSDQTPR